VTVRLTLDEITPQREAVLASVGILRGLPVPDHIARLYDQALERFRALAVPVGITAEIGTEEFDEVFRGEGRNAGETPLEEIYPRADRLVLFATTLGPAVSEAIAEGFETREFALAAMLDAAASDGADRAAEALERRVEVDLRAGGWDAPHGGVLRYSPGYCGWHVTGQKRLFASLEPERIGLTLTPSCLMQPLKSVSGVIVAGPAEIHRFAPTYTFCSTCETYDCRDRLRALVAR
jgi:hypothetical protein